MSSFPLCVLLLFIFPEFIYSLKNVDNGYINCSPTYSNCKPNQKITYPFWEKSLDYCGYPGFKLDCLENNLALMILNQTYNVLDIDYDANVVTLSNPQFSKGPCVSLQTKLTNSSLNLTLFSYTSNSSNATLFYGCSELTDDVPFNFSCNLENNHNYYTSPTNLSLIDGLGFLSVDKRWEDKLREPCPVHVNTHLLNTSVEGLINKSLKIEQALEKGFEVKWIIDNDRNCHNCTGSGGRCGYNYSLNHQVCFCKDGVHITSCYDFEGTTDQSSSSGKDRRRIVTGILAVFGSIIVLIALFFTYWCHHKRHQASPALAALNKSSSLSSATSDDQTSLNRSTYFGVQVFTYKELVKATDNFNPLKELGDGGYGTVYYGKLGDGREVAIKRLYENNQKKAEQFMNEVEILAHLRHQNLVTLHGCTSRQSRELLLVYEYISNGTVAEHLHGKQDKQGLLPWPRRLSIAVETANALVYLHSSDIIHRDVKTQNILLDKDFSVKVADFGLSRLFPLDVSHVSTAPQGTPGYVDPEYHQCYQLTEKSDVYSFGVVLAELISSKPAVDITRARQEINLSNMVVNKIQNHSLHELVDPCFGFETDFQVREQITKVADLAFQCLQSTRDMRPSMEKVLEMLSDIQESGNEGDDSKEDTVDRDLSSDNVLMSTGDH